MCCIRELCNAKLPKVCHNLYTWCSCLSILPSFPQLWVRICTYSWVNEKIRLDTLKKAEPFFVYVQPVPSEISDQVMPSRQCKLQEVHSVLQVALEGMLGLFEICMSRCTLYILRISGLEEVNCGQGMKSQKPFIVLLLFATDNQCL